MALWLVRTSSHSEHEQKFMQKSRVYVIWDELDVDLSKLEQKSDLMASLIKRYPGTKAKAIQNWASQIWSFAHSMEKSARPIYKLR